MRCRQRLRFWGFDHVLASVEKTDGVEWAVAGGGILACAAALLGLLAPTASAVAFFAMTAVLGLVIAGVIATFAWLCGCWDDAGPDRGDRLAEAAERRSDVWARKAAALRKSLEQERRQRLREFPPQTYAGENYLTTLRGFERPKSHPAAAAAANPRRHGQ